MSVKFWSPNLPPEFLSFFSQRCPRDAHRAADAFYTLTPTVNQAMACKVRDARRPKVMGFRGLGQPYISEANRICPRPTVYVRTTYLMPRIFFFFFITLVTGPRRPLSLELSDTQVYGP